MKQKPFIFVSKLLLVILISFISTQFLKNPLEGTIVNSNIIKVVPYEIYFLIVSIPNIIFYTIIGMIISEFIKKNILLAAILFIVFELSWTTYFSGATFYDASLFTYLMVYFPKVIIPFCVIFGIWLSFKLRGGGNFRDSLLKSF